MPDFSFVVVAVIAFTAPVLRELIPKLFVPAIVLELVGGIIVGPQVLDIAHSSQSVELFSTIGLAALLFLAGREIDVNRLRGEVLERGLACFALGFMIAAAIAEFSSVILISFFYSNERAGPSTELVHLCAFALLAIVVFVGVSQGGRN